MMILVGGEKGGSGKSCLAQNLAVYFARNKKSIVLMVDCDTQKTTSDWIETRNGDPSLSAISCIQLSGKIRNELLSLVEHYDYIIIDCGSQDNLALRAAMSVADHVIIPIRPKRRDLKTVPHVEDMLSTCKMVNPKLVASFILTQCPSLPNQVYRIIEAKEMCCSFGVNVLNAVTYSRDIYDDSEESGSSVLEIDPMGKAAFEMAVIAEELLAIGPDNSYKFN